MSAFFFVQNPNHPEILTIGQALELVDGLAVYLSLGDGREQVLQGQQRQNMLNLPIPEAQIRFYKDGVSVSGFRIMYKPETQTYIMKLNVPRVKGDWEVLFDFVKALHYKVGGAIAFKRDEEPEVFGIDPETLHEWSIQRTIFTFISK